LILADLSVIVVAMLLVSCLIDKMKIDQNLAMPPALKAQLAELGLRLSKARLARRVRQSEAASRAGISRATASLIENGSASVSIGQVVRYLDAIAPGKTLVSLLTVDDPVVLSMEHESLPKRARTLSQAELKELDF
jgi:transcriptional regulator with XRE-family HTH domain